MKKTILALAAAGLVPVFALAAEPAPGDTAPATPATPPASTPARPAAPGGFEPKMMFGDVARVLSSKPVYEKAPANSRECRLEGSGYGSAASELPPCDKSAETRERLVGYDVSYQYMGRDFLIRMPYDPGEQMAVNVIVVPPAPERRPGYRIPQQRGPY